MKNIFTIIISFSFFVQLCLCYTLRHPNNPNNDSCKAANLSLQRCNENFPHPPPNVSSYTYGPGNATLAPCTCNEKYYYTLVKCVSHFKFSSNDIKVMSLEQYKKICNEDLHISFDKEAPPLSKSSIPTASSSTKNNVLSLNDKEFDGYVKGNIEFDLKFKIITGIIGGVGAIAIGVGICYCKSKK